MENKINIPEELQQVCKDLAKVAQKHNLYELRGTFNPRDNSWSRDISFSWKAGRHNEDSDEIDITSSFYVHTRISSKTE